MERRLGAGPLGVSLQIHSAKVDDFPASFYPMAFPPYFSSRYHFLPAPSPRPHIPGAAHMFMEIEMHPGVSLNPGYLQRPGRPRRGSSRSHQRPPGIAALQDLLHLRKLLLHPHPAGQKRHCAGCAPAMDSHLQKLVGLADRVFCIYSEPVKGRAKAEARVPGAQRTLGAYS